MPAVTRAIGTPFIPFGVPISSVCSRIPANKDGEAKPDSDRSAKYNAFQKVVFFRVNQQRNAQYGTVGRDQR